MLRQLLPIIPSIDCLTSVALAKPSTMPSVRSLDWCLSSDQSKDLAGGSNVKTELATLNFIGSGGVENISTMEPIERRFASDASDIAGRSTNAAGDVSAELVGSTSFVPSRPYKDKALAGIQSLTSINRAKSSMSVDIRTEK